MDSKLKNMSAIAAVEEGENKLCENKSLHRNIAGSSTPQHVPECWEDEVVFGGPEISLPLDTTMNEVFTPPKEPDMQLLSPSIMNLIHANINAALNRRLDNYFQHVFLNQLKYLAVCTSH